MYPLRQLGRGAAANHAMLDDIFCVPGGCSLETKETKDVIGANISKSVYHLQAVTRPSFRNEIKIQASVQLNSTCTS